VLLVRHGETTWSASGRHTGRSDPALTEAGLEAARRLGPWLQNQHVGRVLVSPLERARETCRSAGFGGQAEVIDDLREWDYGDYEGLTTSAIRADRPGWSLWRDGCPDGEDAVSVGRRADRVIAILRRAEVVVALFSHGHLLRVLTARWLNLAPAEGRLFALDTGAVCALGYEREQPVIRLWNLTAENQLVRI
jgi:probable phosphoglycerate mutase